MQIEHELGERAMQAREITGEHGKACTGDLSGDLEIEPTERFAKRDVIARREIQLARFTPATHFEIGRFVASFGNARMQQVRKAQQHLVQALLNVREACFDRLQLTAQRFSPRQQWRDILPCSLCLADRLGLRVALIAQPVGFDLQLLALLFESGECSDIERKPATCEIPRHYLGFGSQELGIYHGVFFSVADALRWRSRSSASAMRISSPRGTG